MSIHYIKQAGLRLLIVLFFSLLFIKPLFSQTKDQVLQLIWRGIGGKQSWEDARYFMFSCNTTLYQSMQGTHTYLWDRATGNCRFEGINERQEKLIALFNTKDRKGKIFVDNILLSPTDSAQKLLEPIINNFYNDSFWLFFPQKLIDPSTFVINDPELIGNTRYYVVELNTPQLNVDIHRSKLFIDTNTGRIFQWQALSESNEVLYNLITSDFKDVGGGLTLITSFNDTNAKVTITYPIASALINVEADKFLKP